MKEYHHCTYYEDSLRKDLHKIYFHQFKSGVSWYNKYQVNYPNSSSLDDLESNFRNKAKAFVEAMRNAGATVRVNSTKRNEHRAWVMHYGWKLAHGKIAAKDVPPNPDIQIIWDHGSDLESALAAGEMIGINGFNLAHSASLTSNHIKGLAIDMTISWAGNLEIKDFNGTITKIESYPKSGLNPELIKVGESYGIKKHLTDPPHWSINGR